MAKRQSPTPPVRNLDTAGPGRSPTVGGVCIFRPFATYPTGVGKSNHKPLRFSVDFQAITHERFLPDSVAGCWLGEAPSPPGPEGAWAESVTRWEDFGGSWSFSTWYLYQCPLQQIQPVVLRARVAGPLLKLLV